MTNIVDWRANEDRYNWDSLAELFAVKVSIETPTPAKEIARQNGWTLALTYGVAAYIKDQCYAELPIISSRQGYMWSTDDLKISQYRIKRRRTATTNISRLFTGTLYQQRARSSRIQQLHTDLIRALEELDAA